MEYSEQIHVRLSSELKGKIDDRKKSKFVRSAIRERVGRLEAAEDVLGEFARETLRSLMGVELDLTEPLSPQILEAMPEDPPRGVSRKEWKEAKRKIKTREEVALAIWTMCGR